MSEIQLGDILRIKNIKYEVVLDEGILQLKTNAGWRDKDVYCIQPLADILKLDIPIEIIKPKQLVML